MSIIFGLRKPFGDTVEKEDMLTLGAATQPYAPDGVFVRAAGRVGMGFQPFYTTDRGRLETQPIEDQSGNIIVFDGRLDNFADLCRNLGIDNTSAGDSSIVLAAFERWGERCFSNLIGDWAAALYSASQNTLYLARDHAGTRTLYYRDVNGTLIWSTYLETFFANNTRCSLDDNFILNFLNGRFSLDLTPYQGIRAVLPSHYLVIQDDKSVEKRHWEWVKRGLIHYKSDSEYEEHFVSLFRQSVLRRTGPGAKILGELSGGMDSTSIICMSDYIRRSQGATTKDLLDTISFYDDTEPNWDERHYFSITEEARGKRGIHIDVSSPPKRFEPVDPTLATTFFPGQDMAALTYEQTLQELCAGRDFRVILSGIGGDELLGGVPTPFPELADYLMSANLPLFLNRAMQWSMSSRAPVLHLLYKTILFLVRIYSPQRSVQGAVTGLASRLKSLREPAEENRMNCVANWRARPSAISNGRAWWSVLRSAPHLQHAMLTRHEYRYPYLDRDLVDFLLCVPREQLTRPGRRRSLMRRSLKQLLPTEILERSRKAYVSRSPIVAIQRGQGNIERLLANPLSVKHDFLEAGALRTLFDHVLNGSDLESVPWLLRSIALELWFRNMSPRLALPSSD
jgi:asparagine synthase (glutamine-hydrolysing)